MRGPVLLTLPTLLRELGDRSTHFGLLCCFFLRVCVADSLFDDAPEHPCASFTNVLSNFRDMPCYIKCHYGVLVECSNTFDSNAMRAQWHWQSIGYRRSYRSDLLKLPIGRVAMFWHGLYQALTMV
uniref:Putative secreted protein n=1 Tax=Ixodes scapularis TaxID=6945 RepID=A0A4D5RZ89_IXOSC